MATFLTKLFMEYPIPKVASIWGGDGVTRQPIEDINDLVECVVDEVASDIQVTEHVRAAGLKTTLPEGTTTVVSAQMADSFPFQGNRLIKHTFVPATGVCYLRYYPAVITYRRLLTVEDLDTLKGDRLQYVLAYTNWKMAERELAILKAQNMNVDNGQIDLSVLESFRDKRYEKWNKLKEDSILLYSTST